jgi:hypothetical protein
LLLSIQLLSSLHSIIVNRKENRSGGEKAKNATESEHNEVFSPPPPSPSVESLDKDRRRTYLWEVLQQENWKLLSRQARLRLLMIIKWKLLRRLRASHSPVRWRKEFNYFRSATRVVGTVNSPSLPPPLSTGKKLSRELLCFTFFRHASALKPFQIVARRPEKAICVPLLSSSRVVLKALSVPRFTLSMSHKNLQSLVKHHAELLARAFSPRTMNSAILPNLLEPLPISPSAASR